MGMGTLAAIAIIELKVALSLMFFQNTCRSDLPVGGTFKAPCRIQLIPWWITRAEDAQPNGF